MDMTLYILCWYLIGLLTLTLGRKLDGGVWLSDIPFILIFALLGPLALLPLLIACFFRLWYWLAIKIPDRKLW